MASCLRCGEPSESGTLCAHHRAQLSTVTDLTAEQIIGPRPAEPTAWLVDQWGATHGLLPTTQVGREVQAEGLSILHPSVSTTHAQIECSAETLVRVVDRGSLNGSYVNGQRVRVAEIGDGDHLRFGDVSFYFTTAEVATERVAGPGRTVPSRVEEILFSAHIQTGAGIVGLVQTSTGGIVRTGSEELVLGRLEFGLLQALAERRIERTDPSQSFLSSRDLTECLDFNSSLADSDNVRELVRRVRRKLAGMGVKDLIDSRQGAGYRLAWPIRP